MLYRLVRPMRRKGSSRQQFVQRIPADVKARAVGLRLHIPVGSGTVSVTITDKTDAIRCSLRTADPSEAKVRQAQAAAYVETVWRALRSAEKPVRLDHKQAVALSRELYEAWAKGRPQERTTAIQFDPDGSSEIETDADPALGPDAWEAVLQHLPGGGDEVLADEDLEPILGPIVDDRLLRKGIASVETSSRSMLLKAFLASLRDGIANRKRNAHGDYSPDPKASRFPEWEAPGQPHVTGSAVSLNGLVEEWWKEAKSSGRSVSTYESYRSAFKRLGAFLGHDDARSVTAADLVRFKDHRLAQGVSAKTVGDSDLAAFRSVFQWAVDNIMLSSNPAEKVRVKRPKQTLRRSKALTAEEAKAILSHSLQCQRRQERPKTHAAKRWVPWLCAYTGARLGEMVQLRKQDVRQEGNHWVLTITPDAGTVKDKEAREVVLHAHLIDLGFPAFVESAPHGYLFLTPSPGKDNRGVWRSIKNRVTEFVREVMTDRGVAPNHGWRHLFKTLGREAGIEDTVLDAICGHAAKTIGGSYGDVTLKTKAEAMAKFPRFKVDIGEGEGQS